MELICFFRLDTQTLIGVAAEPQRIQLADFCS